MSVVRCYFCEEIVDTDFHTECPNCLRCPFGENLVCGDCEFFTGEECDCGPNEGNETYEDS